MGEIERLVEAIAKSHATEGHSHPDHLWSLLPLSERKRHISRLRPIVMAVLRDEVVAKCIERGGAFWSLDNRPAALADELRSAKP